MKRRYHEQITREALTHQFTGPILAYIIRANLGQDRLRYQIGHPHFHFDNNSFRKANAYMDEQREIVYSALSEENGPALAWAAFGRLTHAAQDFYAHSNYVALWIAMHPGPAPLPESIHPLEIQILTSEDLRSGRIYQPMELLTFIPGVEKWVKPSLPHDSHAWMNLDSPEQGPYFPYALAAAIKRTRYEYDLIQAELEKLYPSSLGRFRGLDVAF